MTVECLGDNKAAGGRIAQLGGIRVGECGILDLSDGCRKHAGLIDGDHHGDLGAVGTVINTARVSRLLRDLVDIGTGLGIGDGAEVDSGVTLSVCVALSQGNACLRHTLGIAVTGRETNLERELVGIGPRATLEHLGQAEACLGIELSGRGA